KYGLEKYDVVETPMVKRSKLDEDLKGTQVDPTHYRSIVGSPMYLIVSRPDLVFAICICTRYQAKPTEKHLTTVKWVSWYLKGTINMGMWYPKDNGFELTAFAYIDDACCQNSRNSTSRSAQFLGEKLEQVENEIVELYFVKTAYELADIFTKAIAREHFEFLINCLGMQSIMLEELKSLAELEEE
ncbi:hypothetical protein Tco_0997216, partial [Tanacetum coccineum]